MFSLEIFLKVIIENETESCLEYLARERAKHSKLINFPYRLQKCTV